MMSFETTEFLARERQHALIGEAGRHELARHARGQVRRGGADSSPAISMRAVARKDRSRTFGWGWWMLGLGSSRSTV
jgi:hypothetical protein